MIRDQLDHTAPADPALDDLEVNDALDAVTGGKEVGGADHTAGIANIGDQT